MRIIDKEAHIPTDTLQDAQNFVSLEEMYLAGTEYKREAKTSVIVGLGELGMGTLMFTVGRKLHKDMRPLGSGVMLAGVSELYRSFTQWVTQHDLQDGAAHIIWAVDTGRADIAPDSIH